MTTYQCQSCDDQTEFEHEQMLKHLREVHGLKLEGMKWQKELLLHMNCGRVHVSQYKWTNDDGFSFIQVVRSEKGHSRR